MSEKQFCRKKFIFSKTVFFSHFSHINRVCGSRRASALSNLVLKYALETILYHKIKIWMSKVGQKIWGGKDLGLEWGFLWLIWKFVERDVTTQTSDTPNNLPRAHWLSWQRATLSNRSKKTDSNEPSFVALPEISISQASDWLKIWVVRIDQIQFLPILDSLVFYSVDHIDSNGRKWGLIRIGMTHWLQILPRMQKYVLNW